MIIDTLKNAHLYYDLAPGLEKGFEFLKTADLENIEPGEYELDGKRVVALVQEYTTMDNPPWETHNYHLDIQYLVKGEEKIGYYPHVEDMVKSGPYNTKTDCDLYEDIEGDFVTIKDDVIMILFPQDGHLPRKALNEPMPVKKIVIKVLI
ncbi:YhcH/YjgK/YiaL family protein [Natronincola peptidivorans]|uniref:YhcH/YjgK/YiaL family protein n=1 Tax=Natronincola peptidivorans TaxID=426128 RepID=A0A1I0G5N6_9FIRM|nr:YhcH/YjgK/YiaL family protein [Natronincola peptidivorans]SET66238.1 YhcH/YjgK/YiaL family protein [Natronincola peptidivorans]